MLNTCTVWKFRDFSISQILREINFWILEVQNLPFWIACKLCNFKYMNFCTFWRLKFTKFTKYGKNGSFRSSRFSKLISRKIWMTERSCVWNMNSKVLENDCLDLSHCMSIVCKSDLPVMNSEKTNGFVNAKLTNMMLYILISKTEVPFGIIFHLILLTLWLCHFHFVWFWFIKEKSEVNTYVKNVV